MLSNGVWLPHDILEGAHIYICSRGCKTIQKVRLSFDKGQTKIYWRFADRKARKSGIQEKFEVKFTCLKIAMFYSLKYMERCFAQQSHLKKSCQENRKKAAIHLKKRCFFPCTLLMYDFQNEYLMLLRKVLLNKTQKDIITYPEPLKKLI